jgi:hypothetical protein
VGGLVNRGGGGWRRWGCTAWRISHREVVWTPSPPPANCGGPPGVSEAGAEAPLNPRVQGPWYRTHEQGSAALLGGVNEIHPHFVQDILLRWRGGEVDLLPHPVSHGFATLCQAIFSLHCSTNCNNYTVPQTTATTLLEEFSLAKITGKR